MQDKFYILKPAVDTKETGHVFPAVESYDDYDFNSSNSVYNLDSDSFPDFTPDIRFKLAKGAKLCDIMGQGTISACGLLISQNIKDVFEKFNLIPHKYFDATIEDIAVIHKYFWVHFVWEDGIKYLDFENSKFQIKRASKDLGDVKIESLKDLHSKQGELGFIKMIQNYEYTFFNPKQDLFIHPLNKIIFISESLKTKMSDISGVELTFSEHLKVV